MVLEVKKNTLVVQANQLVEAKYRLSVDEQKIIRILVSQINREDGDFRDYEFHVRQLAELLGMEHKDPYGVLREITKKLISKVLEFHNPETNTFLQVAWLASAKYKKGEGTVSMSFHPSLKPLLLHIKSYFTKYELSQILHFKGQYAIRFFELRKSFLGRGKNEVFFSLKELWELFKLEKNEYKQFSDFKKRVLEPARLELLEKTGKSFSWEAVKRGRGGKIAGIRIVFDGESEKEVVGFFENVVKTETKRIGKEPVLVTETESELIKKEQSEGAKLLLKCGISAKVAEELATQKELPYLQEKVALANLHPDYIKNKAGFIVKAIQENWVDDDIVKEQQREMRLEAEKRVSETRKRVKGIWDRYRVHRDALGLKKYERMAIEEIEKMKREFLEGLNSVFLNVYRRKESFGYEDGLFRNFFLKRFQLPSFEEFLVTEAITLSEEERNMVEREFERR